MRALPLLLFLGCTCSGGPAGADEPTDEGPIEPRKVAEARSPAGNTYGEVSFTPDGRFLLARESVVDVYAFDPSTGALEHRSWFGFYADRTKPERMDLATIQAWGKTHEGLRAFAMSPDGRFVAGAGMASDRIGLWSLTDGKGASLDVVHDLFKDVGVLAFTDDGRHLLAGGRLPDSSSSAEDTHIRLLRFDPTVRPALTPVAQVPAGERMASMVVSKGLVAVIGSNRFFRLLKVEGDALREVFALEMDDTLEEVRFTADGERMVTTGLDQDIRVWKVERDPPSVKLEHVLREHRAKTRGLALAPDGRWLAATSPDKTMSLWPLAKLDPARFPEPLVVKPWHDYTYGLAAHPTGPWLVTTGDVLQVWRLNRDTLAEGKGWTPRRMRAVGALDWKGPPPKAARWDAEGLLTVDATGSIARDGEVLRQGEPLPEKGWPPVLVAALDGQRAWLGGETPRWVPLGSGDAVPIEGHEKRLSAVAVGGACAVTGDATGKAFTWRVEGPTRVGELQTSAKAIGFAALSPDGTLAITAGTRHDDATRVHQLDPKTCAVQVSTRVRFPATPLGNALHTGGGAEAPPAAAAFSPDGRWMLSGSRNGGSATLWARAGTHLLKRHGDLPGHQYGVTALAFSPDGRHAITAGNEGDTRLWAFDAKTGEATPLEWLPHAANPPAKFAHHVRWSPDGTELVVLGGHYREGRAWKYRLEKP